MPSKFKQPKNLQERIFALIRELDMTVGQKCQLVYDRYGKRHVCQLNREQGLDLEQHLKGLVSGSTASDAASSPSLSVR
jgi:hypothetical protein